MRVSKRYDWSSGSEDEHLEMARQATNEELRALAVDYDWNLYPEKVLGWVMAQKCIDLNTALSVFMRGAPERFNYMSKREVPSEYRGAARVLDNICLRVNSGFYLAYPNQEIGDRQRVAKWLSYQKADRADGRRGRWILDERILDTILENRLRHDRATEPVVYPKPSLWRDLFSPLIDLGVDRQVLKYRPPRD